MGGQYAKKVIALFSLLFVLLTATASAQDFDTGTAAYARGDYATALHEFRSLAEHGHAVAQANLSIMYFHGVGIAKDHAISEKWALRAAKRGYAAAQAQLGYIYLNATGKIKDEVEAAYWYERAAEQGYAAAQTSLGTLYYQGIGVPLDYTEAVKWFRLAAEQFNADAQAKLGVAYLQGNGVTQDNVQAYVWLVNASRLGSQNAPIILDFIATQLSDEQMSEAQRIASDWLGRHPGIADTNVSETPGLAIISDRGLYPNRY